MILNQCVFELTSFEFSFGGVEGLDRNMPSEDRVTIKKFGEKHCQKLEKLRLLGVVSFLEYEDEEDVFPYTNFLRLDSSNHNGTVKSFAKILMNLWSQRLEYVELWHYCIPPEIDFANYKNLVELELSCYCHVQSVNLSHHPKLERLILRDIELKIESNEFGIVFRNCNFSGNSAKKC